MKEDLIKKQPILSKILNNINEKKRISHSYLLVGNNKEKLEEYSLLFTKNLLCPKNYKNNCELCNICKRITNGNYSELKVIKPINNTIKKEEILLLKTKFQTYSLEGRLLVYIINDVELLNSPAANSLLKFLEEPDSNVVAIFTTTNLNLVYETIISRCQIIKLNQEDQTNDLKIFNNLTEEDIKYVIDFINDIEFNYDKAVSNLKEKFLKKFNDRASLKSAIEVIGFYYKDILNLILFNEIEYFKQINKEQKDLFDIENLTSKISFVFDSVRKLDYNVNMLLFMTNFIIRIGELNHGKGSRN